jgi:hypothetical protein
MHSCTCDDYHNGHICKHIHKIHSLCRTLNGHVNDSANESDFELVNPDPAVILSFGRSSLIFIQALFPEIKLVRDLIIVPYL